MVNIFETTNYNDSIISLWQEAFGDTREDVIFFLENCVNKKCLCLTVDDELKSMLFLVDCNLDNHKSKYIYAACTKKDTRKAGYMSSLLEYCRAQCDSVVLIPANEPLVDYYKKRGLIIEHSVDELCFDEIDEIKEYLFEGCELETPFALEFRR